MFILRPDPAYTRTVLPKCQIMTVKVHGNQNATGVYMPKPLAGNEGALTRPFRELVEYLQANGDTIQLWPSGEMQHRPPFVHTAIPYRCDKPLQGFTAYFRHSISEYDQNYTCLVRAPPEVEGGLRCAYRLMLRRVRNKKFVAVGMGSHARLGQNSLLSCLDHEILALVARHAVE